MRSVLQAIPMRISTAPTAPIQMPERSPAEIAALTFMLWAEIA